MVNDELTHPYCMYGLTKFSVAYSFALLFNRVTPCNPCSLAIVSEYLALVDCVYGFWDG